jgi:outer membrane protein assembly factor BamE (lipoprotein component of BamABCDE complex)
MKKIITIFAITSLVLLIGGCATQQQPQPGMRPYTQGNVTLKLKKGVTTQEQVTEAFGAPNIVTQDANGNQVWIYQKDNVTVKSGGTSGYFTILIAGVNSGRSSYEQSSRTMTLTIHFDKRGIVRDFKSMSTSF